MPQTTQIIPKWTFPHIETYFNDYTFLPDDEVPATDDTYVKECLAVRAGRGIDNTWVKKSSRESAVKTFGESNFKLYGQPLMQALNVADQEDTSMWMLRIMPENATYANRIVTASYKIDPETTADNAADVTVDAEEVNPMDRYFRIKLTSTYKAAEHDEDTGVTIGGIVTAKDLANEAINQSTEADDEGYTPVPIMTLRSSGRGKYGDDFSLRITASPVYEKEFGIKIYDFEVLNCTSGLTKEADYFGAPVTSAKYYQDGVTLINDVLDDYEPGITPIDIRIDEDNIETIYNEYIKFAKQIHEDLLVWYDRKLEEYSIPEEIWNGTQAATEEQLAQIDELNAMEARILATSNDELPDLDGFDVFFGQKVNSTEMLPNVKIITTLTSDIDTTAETYNAADYTADEVVDFTSTIGLELRGGDDGYFAVPRYVQEPNFRGVLVTRQWTLEEEYDYCYKRAFNGTYDKRILSRNRMSLNAIFDANYSYDVKLTLYDLVTLREECRLHLDTGIIDTLSADVVASLKQRYGIFNDKLVSVDIHNYKVRDTASGKKCVVTISYFMAMQYANHINAGLFYRPLAKGFCQLSGHIRDSLLPVIDDYEKELKEELNVARLNYWEPVEDNVYQRAVQNTTQVAVSDCLEENNVTIAYTLKRLIENDANEQIYNWGDDEVRATFVATEEARYANWEGTYVQAFEIYFKTSKYEFDHQIMHLYLATTFRPLNKIIITEIDLNRRLQAASNTED